MARLTEREIIRLRKELAVMRSGLYRQTMASDLRRLQASCSWLSLAFNAGMVAAPLLTFAASLALRRSSRTFSLRRLASGVVLFWQLFRKLRSVLRRSAPGTAANP